MKGFWFILFFLYSIVFLSQNKISIYDFANVPQSSLENPSYNAFNDWHIAIPMTNNSIYGGSSGVVLHDVFADNDIPFIDKLKAAAYQMESNDIFLINQKNEWLNIGFKAKNDLYYSFGFYEELDFFSNYPTGISELFFEGTSELGKRYSVDGYSMQSSLVGVYHFGIQKSVDFLENIGIRFKLYSGVFDAVSKKNSGYIYTDEGVNNTYNHGLSVIDVQLKTSGVVLDDYEPAQKPSYYIPKLLLTGNKGLGIDLGYNKQIDYNWYVSASITDLGFVYNTNQINNYAIKGSYSTDGIDLAFDEDEPVDYWQALEDDFSENIKYTESDEKYISWRPTMVNAFVKYSFGEKTSYECNYFGDTNRSRSLKQSFGAMLSAQKRVEHVLPAASIFYERNINDRVYARLSYTANRFSYTDIGFAASVNVWKINLYGAVNNLIGLADVSKSNTVSGHIGLNILMDARD